MLIRNTRGFALPFTLFLTTFITLILAAAFARASSEHLVAQSIEAQVTALSVAQTGLNAVLSNPMATRPASGDSIRFNVVGGYAWVHMDVVQKPADTINNPITYVIRSVGHVIEPNQGNVPQALRTVAQFAQWQSPPAVPSVPALITSANGVYRPAGGELTVQAANQCASAAPAIRKLFTQPPLPSIDTSSGDASITDTLATTIAATAGVDWSQVASGNFNADHNTIQFNDTTYSVQLINGDATITMPNNGTGLLIVTGNLYITGSGTPADDVTWNGAILVGGHIVSRAAYFDLNGVLVTGLNAGMGPPIPPDTLGGAGFDADFAYNPCEVSKALNRLRGFAARPRTWVDNWANY